MDYKIFLLIVFLSNLIFCLLIGNIVIKILKHLKIGQIIREEGPSNHLSKEGTPTMGGFIFLIPLFITTIFFCKFNLELIILLILIFLFSFLGWLDDYLIIKKHNNKGIRPLYKILGQSIIGTLLGIYLLYKGDFTTVYIPFTNYLFDLHWFYFFFIIFIIISTTNAVNLTDGLDGLASTVSIPVLIGLVWLLYIHPQIDESTKNISIILGVSTCAGCIGFLWFNSYKAQVFMGDLGSFSLGAIIAILAIIGHLELWLILLGFVFVIETLSVIIQVTYFKLTKKRIFKMSPLHHHFELIGWQETKIVQRFFIISILCVVISIIGFNISIN